MTREEAIKGLKNVSTMFTGYKPNEEMFAMAIKALEQQPCEDLINQRATTCRHGGHCEWVACDKCNHYESDALSQQPCEDCISREDALMALTGIWTESRDEILSKAIRRLNSIPSVTPKEKTGKWIKTQSGDDMFPEIIVCSKCNNENSHLDFNEHGEPIGKVFIKSKFCPNCGARMVNPQESEDRE